MPGLVDRLYRVSPVWMQDLGVSLYGFMWKQRRFGGRFREYVEAFRQRESYSLADWHRYQTGRLRALLASAFSEVPYYHDLFSRLGFRLNDLENLELHELSNLPTLDKETVRSHPERLLSRSARKLRLNTYQTGGTTGTPLKVRMSTGTDRLAQAAYEARGRRWAGLNYTMSRAMIGGRWVVPQAHARPPFWRYNLAERQVYLSAFHISAANVGDYVTALERFQPDYLVGYASAHYFLARLIDESGAKLHWAPKAVLTSSEKLTGDMRVVLEKVYGCAVFDGYSAIEMCCQATECEYHRLHVSPDVGIVELLGSDGRPMPAGELGEIVATGLLNYDQPLIRYRTGDLSVSSEELCPCGRQMPVLREIVGRLEDTIITTDGREMISHTFLGGLRHIRECQIIQWSLDSFTVRVSPDGGFGDPDRDDLRRRFAQKLGPVDVQIELVDTIERTPGGKFRAVVSHVSRGSQ